MKNVYLMPTDKPSSICQNLLTDRWFIPKGGFTEVNRQYYNIYITSDEEIKEGDWCLSTDKNFIIKLVNLPAFSCDKKIILTTDQDFIDEGIQDIDDEFLEWFVKNPSCEWVKVKNISIKVVKGYNNNGEIDCYHTNGYEIIIPQEEPKQESKKDKEIEDYYIGKTLKLKKNLLSRYNETELQKSDTIKIDKFIDGEVEGCRVAIGYKNGFEYLLFNTTWADSYLQSNFELIDESIISQKTEQELLPDTQESKKDKWEELRGADLDKPLISWDEPKEETLEEIVKNTIDAHDYQTMKLAILSTTQDFKNIIFEAVNKGAKWQQEKSYSEEEVINILVEFSADIKRVWNITEWFKQFKKK
jgi:hypothetical protein